MDTIEKLLPLILALIAVAGTISMTVYTIRSQSKKVAAETAAMKAETDNKTINSLLDEIQRMRIYGVVELLEKTNADMEAARGKGTVEGLAA